MTPKRNGLGNELQSQKKWFLQVSGRKGECSIREDWEGEGKDSSMLPRGGVHWVLHPKGF